VTGGDVAPATESDGTAGPNYWPHLGLSGLPKSVMERITDFNDPR
jgi:hypothetical protein